ncbi:MAG: hypothetical protein AAGC70_13945 [Pseudomonadota bacterium]
MFHRVCAAALIACGLSVSGASAAQMPSPASKAGQLSGGLSVALPGIGAKGPGATKKLKVAQRRNRRRSRRRRNRNRNIAIGIGALTVLGIAAAAANEAEAKRFRRNCRRWLRRCDRGNLRACDRYDEYCAEY